MNDTATSGVTGAITAVHLTLIVLLAIAAMLMIWWGSYRRRKQQEADQQIEERLDEQADHAAHSHAPPPLAPSPPAAMPAERPPVTPSPPPLVDLPPEPAARPVPAAPAPAATNADAAAPVTLLKGLGPKVAARLGELGITTVGQIAALSPADAAALDAELGAFRGRMARDRWIDQAKLLASGDRAGFEATFGKLG